MNWLVWPREGNSVRIVWSFGRWALSSSDPNWCLRLAGGEQG